MADDYNRLAMYAAPGMAPVENRLAQAVLPPGHPSNMLLWLRDQIPQVQADDTSTMSGIYSRLGRTATAIPRAGIETMSNWLRGTHDPNAVRIGEDTIAPLGLFGMGTGMANALTRPSRDWRIAEQLGKQYPNEPYAGGAMLTDVIRARSKPAHEASGGAVITRPDPEVYGVADNVNKPGPYATVGPSDTMPGLLKVTGRLGDQEVGRAHLVMDQPQAYLEYTQVPKENRRQGVATAIYDEAERYATDRGHSFGPSPGGQTDAGFQFWASRDPKAALKVLEDLRKKWPSAEDQKVYSDRIAQVRAMIGDEGTSLSADNARSSVPGTVVQAMAETAPQGRPQFKTLEEARAYDKAQADKLWESVQARKRDESTPEAKAFRAQQEAEIARLMELAKPRRVESSPSSSAPGLAASASQQDDNPVLSILSKYGLY